MITAKNTVYYPPQMNEKVTHKTDANSSANDIKVTQLNKTHDKNSRNSTFIPKVILVAQAIAAICIGYYAYTKNQSIQRLIEETDPIYIPQKQYIPQKHPLENTAAEIFGDEILTFDKNSTKPKLLYLIGSHDQEHSFDALKSAKDAGVLSHLIKTTFIGQINPLHDMRLKVISSPDEFCHEVKEAIKISNLKSIIIRGHGDSNSIELGRNQHLTSRSLKKECFDGLDSDAMISLISCETGKEEKGIAHEISKLSQRIVWAPEDPTRDAFVSAESRVPFIPKFSKDKNSDLKAIF